MVKLLMLVRRKENLDQDLITIKVQTGPLEKKRLHEHYGQYSHNGNDDWQFTLIEKCQMHEELKKRETFWQHRRKTLYLYEFNEKK